MAIRHSIILLYAIIIAVILGILAGWFMGEDALMFSWMGTISSRVFITRLSYTANVDYDPLTMAPKELDVCVPAGHDSERTPGQHRVQLVVRSRRQNLFVVGARRAMDAKQGGLLAEVELQLGRQLTEVGQVLGAELRARPLLQLREHGRSLLERVMVALDGWGGVASAVDWIDEENGKNNETAYRGRLFKTGNRYRVVTRPEIRRCPGS